MSEGDLTAAKSSFDGPVKTITFSGRTIRVCYTVDAAVANAWMDAHFPSLSCNVPTCDDAPMTVIGLDAEWKPRFHRTVAPPRPALVQVSDRDGNVLLIHVCHMKGAFPVRVSAALAHPRVLKVGVGVLDDANKIHVLSRSPVRACVDLVESLLCHLGTEEALPGRSLFKLAAHYLSVGNWKTKSLTVGPVACALVQSWSQRFVALWASGVVSVWCFTPFSGLLRLPFNFCRCPTGKSTRCPRVKSSMQR
jgi:hypothetical protein